MRYAFCEKCDNMMYISLRPDVSQEGSPLELTYSCKHCGFVTTGSSRASDSGDKGGIVVMSTDYEDDQASYKQYATPYLKHDPTLPRARDIECVRGAKCTRPADKVPEVIYVKYDPNNLKYLYHCVHCSAFWKSGGSAQGGEINVD
jgi:hypothetical protein